MKILTPLQIKGALNFGKYKDALRITQEYGKNPDIYGAGGHPGIDVGEQNRWTGDELYAPFDGKIMTANQDYGENIGYGTTIISTPRTINGIKFAVRVLYLHTRGMCAFQEGDIISKGDVVDRSGGVFKWNIWWRGQHTHIEVVPVYYVPKGSHDPAQWRPNWEHREGRYDPLLFLQEAFDVKTVEGKDIKASSPDIFVVQNGFKYKYPDELVFSVSERLFSEVVELTDAEIDSIPYGGIVGFDYTKRTSKVVKQILSLVKDDPERAKKLFDKYYA